MKKLLICLKELLPRSLRFILHKNEFFKKFKCREKEFNAIFDKQERIGLDEIPIFIISFNRLSYIKSLICSLEKIGKRNILITIHHTLLYLSITKHCHIRFSI